MAKAWKSADLALKAGRAVAGFETGQLYSQSPLNMWRLSGARAWKLGDPSWVRVGGCLNRVRTKERAGGGGERSEDLRTLPSEWLTWLVPASCPMKAHLGVHKERVGGG